MVRHLLTGLLSLLSIGWLVPLYFSAHFLWLWLDTEVAPLVEAREPQANSFPLLYHARLCFRIALIWLAIVAIGWSSLLSYRFFGARAAMARNAAQRP